MNYPPFCPNEQCKNHFLVQPDYSKFSRNGYYSTKLHKRLRIFICKDCGRKFSERSFSIDYYFHKKISYKAVLNEINSCCGIRAIGRNMKCSRGIIQRRISRLAKQAIAVHHTLVQKNRLKEDLVAYGFESFSVSQYFPNNIHILVGKESQFLYFADYAYLRRKGRMTKYQKARNRVLRRLFSYSKTITNSFSILVEYSLELLKHSELQQISLYTDEKYQYSQVIHKLDQNRFIHHYRTNSKIYRNLLNMLFAVNYMDREIRKDLAEHVRETTRFSRNVNNSMERLSLFRLRHNYLKLHRINQAKCRYPGLVHAEVAGIPVHAIKREFSDIFTRRRFRLHQKGLADNEDQLWRRRLITPPENKVEEVRFYAA
jgi:transposase-like protein